MNNLSIKFLSVTIQNFRGIPDELVVPLDAPLTVIYAANGTGKSTVCYALEWLITGKVDDLGTAPLACKWGNGKTTVTASCLIDGRPHVLTRNSTSLWITEEGTRKRKITDEQLLEMLTPTSVSGKSTTALRKAKRGWLRNSRWLYSNSLSLLIDNNKADERQQIFADILGFGHLTSTLRDLRDYRKALPNTKGLSDSVSRISAEIEALEKVLSVNSPAKDQALDHLRTIFEAFPPAVEGGLGDQVKAAQLRITSWGQKHQRETITLNTLSEQWTQYHDSLNQIESLRQSVDAATREQSKASEDQVVRAKELAEAQIKVSDGERSIKWADECLARLHRWLPHTANPAVVELFSDGDLTPAELRSRFVEFTWPIAQQEQWQAATDTLFKNVSKILDLERQKQDLIANPVAPATELDSALQQFDNSEKARIRAEADFNAFSNVLEKLKAMGGEIVHAHDDAHCPLCNHDWGNVGKLRSEISSTQQLLSPALGKAANTLAVARQAEQEASTNLSLANAQKKSYDAYLARLATINQALSNFASSTKYLEIMQVQNFTGLTSEGAAYLHSRVTLAMEFGLIFHKLAEVEKFFDIAPQGGAGLRVATAIARFDSYKQHFKEQIETYGPSKNLLVPTVKGLADTVQAKAQMIAGINASIGAALNITGTFLSLWKELFAEQPVSVDLYEQKRQMLNRQADEVATYRTMLSECEAVVSVDTDSLRLKELEQERLARSNKLKIGMGYIADADLAIENYAMHVKNFTASSLKPLLSPAAELFSRMHANEVYKGLGVSEGDDALKWTVFAEGDESALDAEGKLSQGQRQDLALSLYLARARNTGGSFFLDEPIAHLDDLNRVAMLDIFRLVATSMPSMNLILTTASDALARHMAQKFSSITDKHLLNMIHLEGNPRTGVKMTVHRNAPDLIPVV